MAKNPICQTTFLFSSGEGTLKFDHIQGEGGMREGFIHYFLALALALALMETLNKSHSRGEQNMLV